MKSFTLFYFIVSFVCVCGCVCVCVCVWGGGGGGGAHLQCIYYLVLYTNLKAAEGI